jgi:rod shape-determining protein MreC
VQNLLRFIQKYYHVLLFLILQIISLIAIVRYNTYHQSIFFNVSSEITGRVLEKKSDVVNYFNLRSENDKLQFENIELRTRGAENYLFFSNDTFVNIDSNGVIQYSYMAGTVLNNSIHRNKNYFTIDRGRNHGVTMDMGVLSPKGVCGVVVDVSEHFSVAMSILNTDFKLTPAVNNTVHFGQLSWDGKDSKKVQISRISDYTAIKVGEEVSTTSYTHFFPKFIPIGRIASVVNASDGKYLEIEVDLAVDMSTLSKVYIVKNNFRQELDSIEKKHLNEN